MTEIEYRNEFKEKARDYDKIVQSKHIQLIYTLEKQVLEQYFTRIDSKNKTLLDFACGSGRWTQVLEEHFCEVTGVDVSNEMISLARTKCNRAEFIITDITADRPDPALAGRQFDVITAFRFYKNAQQSLRRAATESLPRYLKDDGLFIFDLHLNTFSCMGLLASLMRWLQCPRLFGMSPLLIRTISLADIGRLFQNSAFEIVDYYGMGILPGRSNTVILPRPMLHTVEGFFTRHKMFRRLSYNILVIAKKKQGLLQNRTK